MAVDLTFPVVKNYFKMVWMIYDALIFIWNMNEIAIISSISSISSSSILYFITSFTGSSIFNT